MLYFRYSRSVIITSLITFLVYGSITGCGEINKTSTTTPQVLAKNGAWTWFNDERAIITDSLLFIGYVDTAGYSSVTVHSLKSKWEKSYRLSSFREIDDHNNPAFVQLEDKRILATYAPHNTQPFWYRRFAEVNDAGSLRWSQEQKTEKLQATATYSNLFQLTEEDGRLYNFFRGTNFDPTFMVSDDYGQNWSSALHFISSGGKWTRPYVKYASNGKERIDMLFTQAHPRDAKTDIYHVYYKNGNLYQSNGTIIQPLPDENKSAMPVGDGTLIYDAEKNGRGWVWDLEYSANGTPVAAFVTARDSTTGNDLRYHYARWDEKEGKWHEQEIAYAGTHLYDGENHYAGGITIDPEDPTTVYTSSDVHPSTGDSTGHYQIYRGTSDDNGTTWTWKVLTPEASEDNIRPFVPRGGKKHHAVLWLRGQYTSYKNYDTNIVGLID